MKRLLILVLTNFFILTLILLGKPAKAQTTTITGQFLYGLQLYVLPEKQTPPDYSTAIYSSTIDENDFITSGLYENWLQPRLPDGINGYIYLVDSTHTIKNVYLGGGYLEQGQTLSYPYEPSIEMKHYDAPLITIFVLNPVNKGLFETPTLDYIRYHENNDGSTPRIKLIDATTNENDYNRVKLAINGYDTGYNAGYSIGYNNGQVNGYNNGYEDGQTNGYNAGYNAGQYDFYTEYYDEIYNRGYKAGLGDRQLGVNTVVNFNQLIEDTKKSKTINANTSSWVRIDEIPNIDISHKYLLKWKQETTLTSAARNTPTYQIEGNTRVYQAVSNNRNLQSDYYYWFITPNASGTLNLDYWLQTSVDGVYLYFNFFDLTQIYGIGNEPTQIDTFNNDFPAIDYPYTTSELVNIDYENGYISGYNIGYDDGYPLGYDDGKSYQATQQLTSDGWIKNIFTGIGSFLALEILPGVSIGLIVGIPFIITVAWFVLKMARGGSSE